LVRALSEHEVVQKGERAREGYAFQPFTQDVQGCSGAVGTRKRNALQGLVNALVAAGGMNHEGVCVVMRMLIQPSTGLADGHLRDKMRSLDGEEVEKSLFHCLKSALGLIVGTDIFMDRLKACLSKSVAS
jgi:hypothetical protein